MLFVLSFLEFNSCSVRNAFCIILSLHQFVMLATSLCGCVFDKAHLILVVNFLN